MDKVDYLLLCCTIRQKTQETTKNSIFPNALRPPGGLQPPGAETGQRPAVAGAAAFSKKSHVFLMYAQSEC